jgi:hypothetical protein
MMVNVADPVPALVLKRIPVTGYAMLEFNEEDPVKVGWSNHVLVPAVGL